MSPIEAVESVIRNYANFSGRASRSEYWWWFAFYIAAMCAIAVVMSAFVESPTAALVILALFVVSFIPNLAVTVRRLHDTGRSGAWVFINFVPYVGSLILLTLTLLGSNPVANEWGEPPHGRRVAV